MNCRDIARGKEKVPIPVTNDVDDENYPTNFTYVTQSVWTTPVPINTMISSMSVSDDFIVCNYYHLVVECITPSPDRL